MKSLATLVGTSILATWITAAHAQTPPAPLPPPLEARKATPVVAENTRKAVLDRIIDQLPDLPGSQQSNTPALSRENFAITKEVGSNTNWVLGYQNGLRAGLNTQIPKSQQNGLTPSSVGVGLIQTPNDRVRLGVVASWGF